ncbi:MAG: L-lactate permease [Oscillospiraceae bacterium]|jgi:lactate permease|nr:L-lactate permease [Oscillospiraceae bacterium]
MLTILSLLPIISLLVCLIFIKLKVAKSGTISLALALIIAFVFFGFTPFGLSVAVAKALWLALFVSLIVWCALFLYHLVSDFGAIEVINKNIAVLVRDKFIAFLLLAWLFTGMLQGIAGFGIPSVIVAPILLALGFNPVKSLAAALLGHSWAVTFGSMGAAFFVIQGITGVEEVTLGLPVWVFNTATILMTGIGVCWIYDGFRGIKKGLLYVLPVWAVMAAVQFFIIFFKMYSLATLITALAGLAVMFLLYKLRFKGGGKSRLYRGKLTLLQSVFPYALIMLLLLSFQFIPAQIRNAAAISPNFPATATTAEIPHEVSEEANYNPIRLFVHPGIVLLLAAGTACIIYRKAGIWDSGVFRDATKKTVNKGIPATLALLAFGNMSLVMMDSGMMFRLAKTVADITGDFYPFASPFIGVLASFLTGNNTNSNVMFGEFQYTVANELGLSGAVMSAVQSISGALGCAIGSTLVLMAALATKQTDKIPLILKKLIPLILLIALVLGIINFIVINYIIT